MVLEAGGVPIFPDRRDSATWFRSAGLSIPGVVEFETYKVHLPVRLVAKTAIMKTSRNSWRIC